MATTGERIMRSYVDQAVEGQAANVVLRVYDEVYAELEELRKPLEPAPSAKVAAMIVGEICGFATARVLGTVQQRGAERYA